MQVDLNTAELDLLCSLIMQYSNDLTDDEGKQKILLAARDKLLRAWLLSYEKEVQKHGLSSKTGRI